MNAHAPTPRPAVKRGLRSRPAPGGPPRAPFCFSAGVTGHRPAALAGHGADAGAIEARLASLLASLAAAARRVWERERAVFADDPPVLRLISPLAEGADQIAAEAALAQGYQLHAVLPFGAEDCGEDFSADGRARLEALTARAGCLLELPGVRARALDAYVMAGRATVAHADLLIALWDGLPARGRGGTGEVVEFALRRGAPVIHIPPNEQDAARVIWSGFDPLVTPARPDELPSRLLDDDALDLLLGALLAPPADPAERRFLHDFLCEHERTVRPRVEYPLLLAATGIKRLRRSAFRVRPYAESAAQEWGPFRRACRDGKSGMSSPLDALEAAYCWSDGLAQHHAQTYRSGHVFNFAVAALAVVVGLSVLLAPALKAPCAVAELLLISALIANTHVGTRREWHRRWLDYRQLAERLRPMRSLKLLGLAQPGFPAGGAAGRRWLDWYAAAMWRAIGCPAGRGSADGTRALAALLSAEELRPQIAWNRGNAHQAGHLDHRLHVIGNALFAATIASTSAFLLGYLFAPSVVLSAPYMFVFLSGALPALGTAVFGIRVQGEFAATAARSLATANQLERLADALERPDVDLTRASDLFEGAARTMLADLGEWRLAHQQRKLVIPA